MLDKKQIWGTFLSEFKRGHKVAETAHNINNVFGPGTATEHILQWWFKKFCKGDESLEDEECSGQPLEVDMANREDHRNWSSYNYTRSCWRTQCGLLYGHSVFTANWKGEKDRQVGASWADDKSKCHRFEVSSSLILCNNSEPFFNQIVTCDEKWIL